MTIEPRHPGAPGAVPSRCDQCPSEAKWTNHGSRYCDAHAGKPNPTPDLCCTHGERIDRLVELMEDLVEARTKSEPETCGRIYAVTSPGSTVDYVDCPQPRPCLIHDRPRGFTLADQFNDLLKRHEQSLISDTQFYKILAEITGISYPDAEQVLQRFAGRELNAEEAREAEAAGLLVVECTAASEPEPVFLADRAGRRPEQGHIVNGPRFQAALEEFRQKYEKVRHQELRDGDSPKS